MFHLNYQSPSFKPSHPYQCYLRVEFLLTVSHSRPLLILLRSEKGPKKSYANQVSRIIMTRYNAHIEFVHIPNSSVKAFGICIRCIALQCRILYDNEFSTDP